MKRKIEDEIKHLTQAWRDLQNILNEYRKSSDHSGLLAVDLEQLLKTFEERVFKAVIEE